MKRFILITILYLAFALGAQAQDCPTGFVCLPQATANKLLDSVQALIAAKDAIAKLTNERTASDAVITSANRVIADYKQLDEINGMMILKYKTVIDLYDSVIKMYQGVVEKLETQLNKKKSAWQKIASAAGKLAVLLAGVAIGRGF